MDLKLKYLMTNQSYGVKEMSKNENNECSTCDETKTHTKDHADDVISELQLQERMKKVRNKIVVLSGKGGVGKSTVAVNLAQSLANRGKRVGLLDVDVHGPSVPTMLGLDDYKIQPTGQELEPALFEGMKVISIGFLLPDHDSPVIWRGPLKMGVIQQFLRDVNWGELDYLIIDAPPGTGDEPLTIGQLVPEAKALIVTTPQKVATMDVRKSITFCNQMNLPILGIVENMNGMVCPKCGEHLVIFPNGEAKEMASQMGVEFLASLPMDPNVASGADQGQVFVNTNTTPIGESMMLLVDKLVSIVK